MPKSKKEINRTHGMCYTNIYHIWAGMKQRCLDENRVAFKNYGGRGISVCKDWLTFENFYNDMHAGYKKGLTLERVNNNGNYEPSNVIWIPKSEQSKNRRTARLLTFEGKTLSVTEWAEIVGLSSKTIFTRVYQKWSIQDTLTLPITTNQYRKEKISK